MHFCQFCSKRSGWSIPACSGIRVKPCETACSSTQLPYVRRQKGSREVDSMGEWHPGRSSRWCFCRTSISSRTGLSIKPACFLSFPREKCAKRGVVGGRGGPLHSSQVGRRGGITSSRGTSTRSGYISSLIGTEKLTAPRTVAG